MGSALNNLVKKIKEIKENVVNQNVDELQLVENFKAIYPLITETLLKYQQLDTAIHQINQLKETIQNEKNKLGFESTNATWLQISLWLSSIFGKRDPKKASLKTHIEELTSLQKNKQSLDKEVKKLDKVKDNLMANLSTILTACQPGGKLSQLSDDVLVSTSLKTLRDYYTRMGGTGGTLPNSARPVTINNQNSDMSNTRTDSLYSGAPAKPLDAPRMANCNIKPKI